MPLNPALVGDKGRGLLGSKSGFKLAVAQLGNRQHGLCVLFVLRRIFPLGNEPEDPRGLLASGVGRPRRAMRANCHSPRRRRPARPCAVLANIGFPAAGADLQAKGGL